MHLFIVYYMPLSLAHTIQSNFRSWAGWWRSGLIQVPHENLLTETDKNHEISRLYTLGPVWHSQVSPPKYKSETYTFKPASSVFLFNTENNNTLRVEKPAEIQRWIDYYLHPLDSKSDERLDIRLKMNNVWYLIRFIFRFISQWKLSLKSILLRPLKLWLKLQLLFFRTHTRHLCEHVTTTTTTASECLKTRIIWHFEIMPLRMSLQKRIEVG
jgi:hypothetical protein